MKRKMIYALWSLAIGWSLFLNQTEVIASLLLAIIVLLNIKNRSPYYLLNVFIIYLFNLFMFQFGYFDKDIKVIIFLFLEALLTAIIVSYAIKMSFGHLFNIYLFISLSFLFFFFITFLLSLIIDNYIYIHNIYIYIILIFLPSLIFLNFQIFKKIIL